MKKKYYELVLTIICIGILLATSYSFFSYFKDSTETNQIIAGTIYLETNDLGDVRLDDMYPMSDEDGINKGVKYQLNIRGHNDSENDLYYGIYLNQGEALEGKKRFKDDEIKVYLTQTVNNETTVVYGPGVLKDFNNKLIHADLINERTLKEDEVEIDYELTMWIDEKVLISDTIDEVEGRRIYTSEEFENSYATITPTVIGDFNEKRVNLEITTRATLLTSGSEYDVSKDYLNTLFTEENVRVELTSEKIVTKFVITNAVTKEVIEEVPETINGKSVLELEYTESGSYAYYGVYEDGTTSEIDTYNIKIDKEIPVFIMENGGTYNVENSESYYRIENEITGIVEENSYTLMYALVEKERTVDTYNKIELGEESKVIINTKSGLYDLYVKMKDEAGKEKINKTSYTISYNADIINDKEEVTLSKTKQRLVNGQVFEYIEELPTIEHEDFIGYATDSNGINMIDSTTIVNRDVQKIYAIYESIGLISEPTNSLCVARTYNGTAQQITSATSETGYTLSGYSQTNAGSYTVTATLKEGYKWSDNTTGTKTFSCSIAKANPIVTLNPTSGTVVVGSTMTFTETANVAGSFDNVSGTTSVATVSPANHSSVVANTEKTVTITGVAGGSSTITVTFTPTDTTNYNNKTETYTANVITKPTCTFTGPVNSWIKANGTTNYTLDCTDTTSFSDSTLTSSDFTLGTDGIVTLSEPIKSTITNGYRYVMTVIGATQGTTNLTLKSGVLSNTLGGTNNAVTSSNVNVDTTLPTVSYNLSGGTYNTTQTVTVTASDAGGSEFNYMNVHVYKDGVKDETKSIDLHTTSTYNVTIEEGNSWIIYAKIHDKAGNQQNQSPNNGAGWYYQEYEIYKPIRIYLNANGGIVTPITDGGTFEVDGSNFILRDNNYVYHSITANSREDLVNYNNSDYLYVTRTGYVVQSGEEWNSKANGTGVNYNHNTEYTYEQYLDDPNITDHGSYYRLNVYVNWISKPVCTFTGPATSWIKAGATTTYTLNCTDTTSFSDSTLTSSDFTLSSSGKVTISTPTKSTITNGYKYVVTVIGATQGTTNLTLKSGVLSNTLGVTNNAVTSSNVNVDTTLPTVSYNLSGGTYNTTQTVTVTASDTGGSGFNYMNVHVYKDGVKDETKSIDLRTTSTYNVTIEEGHSWIIYAKIHDKAGNQQNQNPNNGAGWYYQEYQIYKPIRIYLNANGGTVTPTTAGGTFGVDSSQFISYNNNVYHHNVTSDGSVNLWNYNNPDHMNITKVNYMAKSGEEWNSKANGTGVNYNHNTEYTYQQCLSDPNIIDQGSYYRLNLYVNWISKPVCTFAGPAASWIKAGATTTYTLNCTDTASFSDSTLTSSDFTLSSSGKVTISTPTKSTITNGYKYVVTVTGATQGTTNLTLKSGVLSNTLGGTNDAVTSSNIIVDTTLPTVNYSIAGGSYNTTQTVTVTASDTGGSGFDYMNIQVNKNGVRDETKSVNVLRNTTYSVTLEEGYSWRVSSIVYDKAENEQNQSPASVNNWYYQEYEIYKPIRVYFNVNGGTVTPTTNGGTFGVNSSNFILRNNSDAYQTINSDGTVDLWNYNSSTFINITKGGYTAQSGAEWNSRSNGTGVSYNHSSTYTYNQILGDSTITEQSTYYRLNLYVNWVAKPIRIYFNVNGGTVTPTTNGGTFGVNSSNFILRNNSDAYQTVNSGGTVDLWNYNSPTFINITKSSYIGKSGAEWNSRSNGTGVSYNHSSTYTYNQILGDSTITEQSTYYRLNLYVNWTASCVFGNWYSDGVSWTQNNPGGYQSAAAAESGGGVIYRTVSKISDTGACSSNGLSSPCYHSYVYRRSYTCS